MIDGSVLQSAQSCFVKKSRVVVKMVVNYEYALHKCRVDRSSEELLAASPECPKRVRLPQLNRKAIPKKCSRVAETIFHEVCTG